MRVYGGVSNADLDKPHQHTAGTQKYVNLLDDLLGAFRGKGHCVTMDSAYMGSIMAQILQEEWKINAVGTAQANRVGPNVKEALKSLKKGTYKSLVFQHKTKPLVYALWSDNNIVKTLSNFHTPEILPVGDGLKRKKREADGRREQHKSEVKCPSQNKDYSKIFHLIDKGNKNEAKYDLAGMSRTHNWTPKLVLRLFNMAFNNAMKVYLALVSMHTPDKCTVPMPNCISELATHYTTCRAAK